MTSASAEERARLIEAGIHVADAGLHRQDLVWARHSSDKPDIGTALFRTLRRLLRDVDPQHPLRALSVGSSSEPQFRVLHASCEGGLFLMDRDERALAAIEERVRRQHLPGVTTVGGDYVKAFADAASAAAFVRDRLGGERMDLVLFHHSLYYAPAAAWPGMLRVVMEDVLRTPGAIHAVLMAKASDDAHTTTWLYNHFAGRFFGHVNVDASRSEASAGGEEAEVISTPPKGGIEFEGNDQCLRDLAGTLRRDAAFRGAAVTVNTTRVRFDAPDFESLMAVVWMILLYPHVHRFTVEQRREITEQVWREFFEPGRPLTQEQDHLVVHRGA